MAQSSQNRRKHPSTKSKLGRFYWLRSRTTAFFLAGYALIVLSIMEMPDNLPYPDMWGYITLFTSIAAFLPVAVSIISSQRTVLKITTFLAGTGLLIWYALSEPLSETSDLVYDNIWQILFDAAWFSPLWLAMITAALVWIILFTELYQKLKSNYAHILDFLKIFIAVTGVIILTTSLPDITQQYRQYTTIEERLNRLESHLGGVDILSCNRTDVAKKVSRSIVRVVGTFSEGSGVIISEDGTIVTNYHVVAFEPSPRIVFDDYYKTTSEYVYVDPDADLAILKINEPTPYFLPVDYWSGKQLQPLDPVYSFGFPLGTDVAGGVTIQEGHFVERRTMDGISYVQTDLSLQQGQSGGALTDACGNLVAINTKSLSGASFSVGADVVSVALGNSKRTIEPPEEAASIEFREDESALEAVRAFYNYQVVHQLEKAYGLLSPEFLDGVTFEEWQQGYADVIGIDLIAIEETDEANTIFLKFSSVDLINETRVQRFFEGTWVVKQVEDGRWLLDDPEIAEVEAPGWDWFWEG